MYSSDKPISKTDEDLLKRAAFSKNLGKAIYKYNVEDSLVIGVYGGWGTGKTSVINMAMEELETLAKSDEKKPIIARFAPWNYSSQEDLISQFFKLLGNKLKIQGDKRLAGIGNLMQNYGGAFKVLKFIPFPGSEAVGEIAAQLADSIGSAISGGKDLSEVKEELEKALSEANQKIVVVIDDIDRLTSNQIRDIFQLVKQVANLPHIIYVLVMDRDVVCKSLKEVQNGKGEEYLEKIIQIPFTIPYIEGSMLSTVISKKLNKILEKPGNTVEVDNGYWNSVYTYCIAPYLKTVRDVNRLMNAFSFRYEVLKEEICLEDIMALTALDVLDNNTYRWIGTHQDLLCGEKQYQSKSDMILEQSKAGLVQYGVSDVNRSISAIAVLFPRFASLVGATTYAKFYSDNDIRFKMRVAQAERYSLFFSMDLSDMGVSRERIKDCINKYSPDDLDKELAAFNRDRNTIFFMREFVALIPSVPYDRINTLLDWLFRNLHTIDERESYGFFSVDASEIAYNAVKDLLQRLTTEERFKALERQINKKDANILAAVGKELDLIRALNEKGTEDSYIERTKFITDEQQSDLDQLYSSTVKDLSKTQNLLDCVGFSNIITCWENTKDDSVTSYMQNLLEDDDNCLKYICRMSERWDAANDTGWKCEINEDYIKGDDLLKLITRYDKEKLLKDLSHKEQLQVASFELSNDDPYCRVSKTKADEKVVTWEYGISE